MKQYKKIIMLTLLLMNTLGAKSIIYDIAVENADGVTIYYYIRSENGRSVLQVTRREYDYSGYSGIVVIPEEVTYNSTTYKVTSINYGAFRDSKDLTSISIPNSVTTIWDDAFQGCTSLVSVNIPNSVTTMGGGVFQNCI